MGSMVFAHDIKVVPAITVSAGAAGITAINGAAIDMAGFDGVFFVVTFGAIVAGAVTSIKVQQDTTAAFGAPADLLGSGQTIADTDDDKVFYVDVKAPRKDFVRLVVSRATQNATVMANAFLYGSRSRPVAHGANVAGEVHERPAEGTA
jgi:hypothetical protein